MNNAKRARRFLIIVIIINSIFIFKGLKMQFERRQYVEQKIKSGYSFFIE